MATPASHSDSASSRGARAGRPAARGRQTVGPDRRTARAGGPWMVDRSTLCRPGSNLNALVAPIARGQPVPGPLTPPGGDNEVGRWPTGPAYGPVVYLASQHDPTVLIDFLIDFLLLGYFCQSFYPMDVSICCINCQ